MKNYQPLNFFFERVDKNNHGNQCPGTFQNHKRYEMNKYGSGTSDAGTNDIKKHIRYAVLMKYIYEI